MTRFESGSVVLVRFPFSDLSVDKKRPAIVVCGKENQLQYDDIAVVPVTSRPPADGSFLLNEKAPDWSGRLG